MAFEIIDGFSYNGYVYGENLAGFRDGPTFENKNSESSAYEGSSYGRSRLIRRQLELRGTILADTHEDLRTAADEFLLAHGTNYPAKLVCYTDRYLWAQVDGDIQREHSNARQWGWNVNFRCVDPYYYSTSLLSVAKSASALGNFNITRTTTVTAEGTAFATPIISFVITDYTQGAVTVENITTGELISFTPGANGTYYYYSGPNCADTEPENRQYRFKLIKSTIDYTNLCTELGDMRLSVGANTIQITGGGMSDVVFAWRNRYV